MGSAFLSPITGESNYDFGGNVNVIYVNHVIRSLGNIQPLDAGTARRVMRAGWLGLGYDGGVFPAAPPAILWWKYLDFESESVVMTNANNGNVNCDHLYYSLVTGVSIDLYIAW